MMITKVYTTPEEAQAEVARMNDLNADKGCRYFVQVGRLVLPDDDDTPE